MIGSHKTGVTNLWAVTHTWPLFFTHHPYALREAVDTYLQRHPYAILYSFFNFSPKSITWWRDTYTTLHVLKDAKPQARRVLLTFPSDDLIKAIVECAINTLNGNHKLTKDEKSKLSKFKNRLRSLVNPKISFKSKRKRLVQKGGYKYISTAYKYFVQCHRSNC